jgi:hypothetical protein
MEHPPARFQDAPTSTRRTQHDAVRAVGSAAHGQAINPDLGMASMRAIDSADEASMHERFHPETSSTRQHAKHSQHLWVEDLQAPTLPSSRMYPMHMREPPQVRRGSSPRTASRNLLKSFQRMRYEESRPGSLSTASPFSSGFVTKRPEFNLTGSNACHIPPDGYQQRAPGSGTSQDLSARQRRASISSSGVSNSLETGHVAPVAPHQMLVALDERSLQQHVQYMLDTKLSRRSLHAFSVATSGATSVATGVQTEDAGLVSFSSLNPSVPDDFNGATLHWDMACVPACVCVKADPS